MKPSNSISCATVARPWNGISRMVLTVAIALSALPSWAQNEWNNAPKSFAVNVLKPHATSMPYSTIEEAVAGDRKASKWYQTLAGTWKFSIVNTPAERSTTFYQDTFDPTAWKDIAVPGSWQTQGFDRPIYTNFTYPWSGLDKISPPVAPTKFNPVGHYRRTFTVPAGWDGKRIRLHFEGVESAYYVWVNGQSVGYSENTFTDHEFDITDKLRAGTNNISVQVFRWCDGSWLEDQDMIRLAGIFRDVYLYATPKAHIQDFQIDAGLATNYKDGDLKASVWLNNYNAAAAADQTVDLHLYDDKGVEVGTALSQKASSVPGNGGELKLSFQSAVTAPALWSAEKPNLYTLVLVLKDAAGTIVQTESARIGFRKVEVKKDAAGMTRFYVNNQPVKLKGTNRHEMDPDHGRVISLERMKQDVSIMKQFNLNALRMSHYPNDPRMYDLCDQYGIYLIDEANLETHGVRDDVPKSSDDWRAAGVERMTSMIQRDKNHPSIVIWSLGNEAGNGNVFTSMRDYAHSADATRPVHYEGDWANADVNSWMYYKPTDVKNYSDNSKPIMLCEYDHAMGNSVGNLKEYVDAFYANPRSFGGFIWDFVDQGLRRGTTNFFNFGGLWGDSPNDDNFCANGLIFPDRTIQPEIWEVKKQYSNIVLKDVDVAKGTVAVENRNCFTNVGELVDAVWMLQEDGKTIQTGTLPSASLDIAPLTTKNVTVPFTKPVLRNGSDYHLDIDFRLKAATAWAETGHSVVYEQLKVPFATPLLPKIDISKLPKLTVAQNAGIVDITGQGFTIAFDTKKGTITNYSIGSVQVIKEGPVPNFWRAPQDNDKGNGMGSRCAKWQNAGRDRTVTKSTVTNVSATETKIDLTLTLPNAGSSSMTMGYTFYGSGDVVVEYTLTPDATMAEIPNVGTLITVPGGFETLRWFGRGPYENYTDRNLGSAVGIYSGAVDSMTIPYMEIGETGQRTDVRWAALTNTTGIGLLAVGSPLMEINAQHHTPAQLTSTKLPWDLTRQSDITFRVDLRQMGVGGIDSWGSKPLDAYMNFAKNTYKHTFRLSPIASGSSDPGSLARMGFKNLSTSDSTVEYATAALAPGHATGWIAVGNLGRFSVLDPERIRSVQVLDVRGRMLREGSVANGNAAMPGVAPGLYIVRLMGTGRTQTFVTTVTGRGI
jgi:beta-galactosidase